MEEISICFNCSKEIPNKENYFFCSKCLTQVKCKACSENLEKDAIGCSNCGTSISEVKSTSNAVNNIEFEQNGEKKKFVANFTDHIGEGLVSTLSGLFLGANIKSTNNPFSTNKNLHVPQHATVKKDSFEDAVVIDIGDDELNQSLTKIFRFDRDKIVLINTRVKQSGKLDHAIRLSLLTLYAYSVFGKAQIARALLNEILNHAKVYDGNYRVWMANCDEISKLENGEIIELSLPGITAAKNILLEFNDPGIDKGKTEFSGSKSKKRKKKKTGEEANESDLSKKSNSKNSPLQSVEELIKDNYFSKKRKINEVAQYLKDNKATVISTSSLSTVFGRLIKGSKINREKNSDGQYEYYK